MIDRSFLEVTGTTSSIKTSVAYNRGMIVAIAGSWFEINYIYLELNTAYKQAVFLYMSEATDITIFQNKAITTLTRYTSYIDNCLVEKNEVLFGGKLISVMTGNLVIQNCKFTKNYIY